MTPTELIAVDFFPLLLDEYFTTLQSIPAQPEDTSSKEFRLRVQYCERLLELLIDLLSQRRTRQFIRPLIMDVHFYVRSNLAPLTKLSESGQLIFKSAQAQAASSSTSDPSQPSQLMQGGGRVFFQQLSNVNYYLGFEIDDVTGTALTDNDILDLHYTAMQKLQRVCFSSDCLLSFLF